MFTLKKCKTKACGLILGSTLFTTLFTAPLNCLATTVDYNAEFENHKLLPVQSNEYENWPEGPVVGSESAILMEANTGAILYSKNINEELYPASTTKMITALLAVENCSMDEMVTFSKEAVFGIERGSSNAGIDVGEQISMEECLYIVLLYSANEVTAGVGEHVAGSIDKFVDMMNERAKELGCLNTHFANSNGLPDENHYTSAYDLALIAKEFYKNETLCKISSTSFYTVYPTETQPDQWDMKNHHKLCENLAYAYDGFIGGKTGYTNVARQTLVSGATRNGMTLICVVMKDESPYQFKDTIALLDYGFQNFTKYKIAEHETRYDMGASDFFNSSIDIFGNSKQIISVNQDDYIVLPNTADFMDASSEIVYDEKESTGENDLAHIAYNYHGVPVGFASIEIAEEASATYDFDGPVVDNKPTEEVTIDEPNVIFINIVKVVGFVLLFALLFIIACFIFAFMKGYHFGNSFLISVQKSRRRAKRRKQAMATRKDKKYMSSTQRKKRKPYRNYGDQDIDF